MPPRCSLAIVPFPSSLAQEQQFLPSIALSTGESYRLVNAHFSKGPRTVKSAFWSHVVLEDSFTSLGLAVLSRWRYWVSISGLLWTSALFILERVLCRWWCWAVISFFLGELVKEISRISTTQHVTLNWGSQILHFDYLGITLNPLTWNKHVKITLKYIAHQIKDRNSLCKNNIACILTVILWLVTSIKIISDGAMPFKLGWGRRKSP